MKKDIILAAVFAVLAVPCGSRGALAADQAVPESLIKELRPELEFNEEQIKEPFADAFSKAPKESPTEVPLKKPEAAARPPLPGMSIQGVIWGSSVPCVIINNRVLKEGELLDEVQVTSIKKEGVELLYRGWNYTLSSPAGSAVMKNPEGGKQ